MHIEHKRITHHPMTHSTDVIETEQHVLSEVERREAHRDTAYNWIAYITGIAEVLLALRILFLFFGAHAVGFGAFLYNLTSPLVAPFRGIFPSPTAETGFFDSAAFLGMIVYWLVAWALIALVDTTREHAV